MWICLCPRSTRSCLKLRLQISHWNKRPVVWTCLWFVSCLLVANDFAQFIHEKGRSSTWVGKWFLRDCWSVNRLLHKLHSNRWPFARICSLMWTRLWSKSCFFVANDFTHFWHAKGRFSLWVGKWFLRDCWSANCLLHKWQSNKNPLARTCSLAWTRLWSVSCFFVANDFKHFWHEKGRSSKWVAKWFLIDCLRVNRLLHKWHSNERSLV